MPGYSLAVNSLYTLTPKTICYSYFVWLHNKYYKHLYSLNCNHGTEKFRNHTVIHISKSIYREVQQPHSFNTYIIQRLIIWILKKYYAINFWRFMKVLPAEGETLKKLEISCFEHNEKNTYLTNLSKKLFFS